MTKKPIYLNEKQVNALRFCILYTHVHHPDIPPEYLAIMRAMDGRLDDVKAAIRSYDEWIVCQLRERQK